MDIDYVKALCNEHSRLEETVELITRAEEQRHWIAIKTPSGENYLSDEQVKVVLDLSNKRIKEIKKELEE